MQSEKSLEENASSESQLLAMLRKNLDILKRHPELLSELEIPHQAGGAASLIERQVSVLRENLKSTEKRLRRLMDIARDNERLSKSRHRIAINLLGAHDLTDVISVVLDELKNELKAEHAEIRLISDDATLNQKYPSLFVSPSSPELNVFSTMLKHKNPVCGRSSEEQKLFLFGEQSSEVGSAAVIPLVSGANLGLLGLGGRDPDRFQTTMGTDFLSQIGELVSAALAVHLER